MIELSSPTASCRVPFNLILVYTIVIAISISNLTEIEGGFEFDSLIKLPHFWNPSYRTRSTAGVLYVNDYGATGDGIHDDTQAFRDVWKVACSSSKDAKIVLPAGSSYILRPIDFGGPCSSKLTLRISGSIIAPQDPSIWHDLNPRKWLYFHSVNNLTVEGNGVIDGRGHEWWARSCKRNTTNPCRHAPTALTFHRCDNLKIRKLTTVNSQQMHIAFTSCDHVSVSHLKVIAPGSSPNTDGIHISSSHRVEVKNCIIGTGDDCISIVGNSSSIRMKDITCGPGHGISIGSLGKAKALVEVHDVRLDGALISDTENGVRIKTWQGGSGYVTKVVFRNVVMKNVSNPIIIDQYYCDSPFTCHNQTKAVKVEDVSFFNIRGTSAKEEAITFACSEAIPCEKLHLEDIDLVSCSGGSTRSFCREARGSWSGRVYPHPCLSCRKAEIGQRQLSTFALQPIVNSSRLDLFVAVM